MIVTLAPLLPAPAAGSRQTPASTQAQAESQTQQFGGKYEGMDPRKQKLVRDWVSRFSEVSGQKIDPAEFYDTYIRVSVRTTFDAITNALMLSKLTTESGDSLGDALGLVDRLDAVKGQVTGARGDFQFRIYVRLREDALDTLDRSREFKRVGDNTVYHKGFPLNYREQGGSPSIQFSVALDRRNADIDVDYRSSSFPAGLFNGHLTAANSDVRAGDNYDRHTHRWSGLTNWWRSFFGVPLGDSPEDTSESAFNLMRTPRIGNKGIDDMVDDFMQAWLVEGNQIAAMSYISERAYACLAEDGEDASTVDRGMAPFTILKGLKAAHDRLGPHTSLEGVTVGVRLPVPDLKVVDQPHHAQFVIASVPDNLAARVLCENRLTQGPAKPASAKYGNYYSASFYVDMPSGKDSSVELLWGRDQGYWKIVSWDVEPIEDDLPPLVTPPDVAITHVQGDPAQIIAAKDFLQTWLLRKDYDRAFKYLAPSAYACYDLYRPEGQPAATSPEDAAQRIRAGLERVGNEIVRRRTLSEIVEPVEPTNPIVRLVDHQDAAVFTLVSIPNDLADATGCAARARSAATAGAATSSEYGKGYGLIIRFRTEDGEAPVLRMLWMKDGSAWRIVAYTVEMP